MRCTQSKVIQFKIQQDEPRKKNKFIAETKETRTRIKASYVAFKIRKLNNTKYRKIPIISPGLIFVQKAFLLGLFSGEFIFGGAYYW